MVTAQEWLEKTFSDKNTKEINSKKEELTGEIKIENYPELEVINFWQSKEITKVTISGCPKVKHIDVSCNKIAELVGIEELVDLERLNIGQNEIKGLNLLQNKKLKVIICYNNPLLDGSIDINDGLTFFNGSTVLNTVAISTKGSYKEKLSEVAKGLGIKEEDLKDKTIQEIKELIENKVKELAESKENIEKINDKLPGLIDPNTGKVDENKLNEIKEKNDIADSLKGSGIATVEDAKRLIQRLEIAERILGPDYMPQIEIPTS